MLSMAAGFVQKIERGNKKSLITFRIPSSRTILENKQYKNFQNGFFLMAAWEDNYMSGTKTTFSKFLDSLKVGSAVLVTFDITQFQNRDQENNPVTTSFNIHKIEYLNMDRPEKKQEEAAEYWKDVPASEEKPVSDLDEDYSDVDTDLFGGDEDYESEFTPDPF